MRVPHENTQLPVQIVRSYALPHNINATLILKDHSNKAPELVIQRH
jgi:hypothetical protein